MAEADAATLAALLAEATPSDGALRAILDALGQQHGIHRPGLIDADAVPPPPGSADVYVKTGELWILGEHRLLVGGSLDPEQVARLFDGASATLLVTDTPDSMSHQKRSHSQDRPDRHPDGDAHPDDDRDTAAVFYRSFLAAA
jgi:hypothetical protein